MLRIKFTGSGDSFQMFMIAIDVRIQETLYDWFGSSFFSSDGKRRELPELPLDQDLEPSLQLLCLD